MEEAAIMPPRPSRPIRSSRRWLGFATPALAIAVLAMLAPRCASALELREVWRVPAGGIVSAPPVVAGGTVFVGSWDQTFYALDAATGDVRWKFETGGIIGGHAATISGPLVLFGSSDGQLRALDRTTGRLQWSIGLGSRFADGLGIAVRDSELFAGFSDGAFYAFRIGASTARWMQRLDGAAFGRPCVSADRVFVATLDTQAPPGTAGGTLFALERASGKVAWKATLVGATGRLGGARSGPLLWKELVIVADASGVVRAFSQMTGSEIWRVDTGSAVVAEARVEADALLVGNTAGDLCAISPARGKIVWRTHLPGSFEHGPPAVAGDRVFVASADSYLYVLERGTGKIVANYRGAFAPEWDQGRLYLGGFDPSGTNSFVVSLSLKP
jgi:serine/threonine-protein kinase